MRPELLNTVLILALTAAVVLSGILLRAVRRLRVLADTDPLTGLANRRAFQARLSALEYSGQTITIASLDLNDLKEVNDARGHPAGDALLRWTADILRAACVPQYRVYRVGGDEFLLLGWQQTPEQADRFLSRLRERLYSEGVDAALGWSTAPAAGPLSSLLTESDRNMYLDKRRCKY